MSFQGLLAVVAAPGWKDADTCTQQKKVYDERPVLVLQVAAYATAFHQQAHFDEDQLPETEDGVWWVPAVWLQEVPSVRVFEDRWLANRPRAQHDYHPTYHWLPNN